MPLRGTRTPSLTIQAIKAYASDTANETGRDFVGQSFTLGLISLNTFDLTC
jgi:hypothetical protein